MEIREYLRAKRRWLPALVVVPLLAGAGAAGMVTFQQREYTAEVHGYVPPAQANNDSQIGLYIARLNEGLLLGSVQDEIATTAQIDPSELDSVGVERSGQSDQFVVAVVTTVAPDRATAVAETVAKVGTAFVARQATLGADTATEIARQSFQAAQDELFAYQDEIGDLDPNVTYANVSRSLLTPDPRVDVAALQAQQLELVGQVRRYNELRAVFQSSSGSLGAAQSQSVARAAEVVAAEDGSQILFSELVPDSPISRYLEPAGLAIVLTFIVLLGLSLVPDLLRRTQASFAAGSPAPRDPVPAPQAAAADPGTSPTEPRLEPHRPMRPANGAPVGSASGSRPRGEG